MKLKNLKDQIDKLVEEFPEAMEARVLIDTEARRFNSHYVEVENVEWDQNLNAWIEDNIVTIRIDLEGTEV